MPRRIQQDASVSKSWEIIDDRVIDSFLKMVAETTSQEIKTWVHKLFYKKQGENSTAWLTAPYSSS